MLTRVMRSIQGRGKSLTKRAVDSAAGFQAVHLVHRALALISTLLAARGRSAADHGVGVVIVCPPGGGNIGDQALVESACWNLSAPVVLVVRSEDNYEIPEWLESRRVQKVALPELLYGMSAAHLRDVLKFLRLSRRAEAVVVVGADVMDGCYNAVASINRWSLAVLAGQFAKRASVLGFSWNAVPAPSSTAGLLRANRSVALWVRDPISLGRVRGLGASKAQLCADIVFAHPVKSLAPEVRKLPQALEESITTSRQYAIVNASGYIGNDTHVFSEYKALMASFVKAGLDVILLPHVMRGRSDLECLRALHKECDSILVDRLLTPSQVSDLTSKATIVVTGRMHLAVLASMENTPVLTLATQGKVDGLYDLLGRPEWVLNSNVAFSQSVSNALDEVMGGGFEYSSSAAADIRRLAKAPFQIPGTERTRERLQS